MREILSKKTRRRETIPGRGLYFDIIGRIGTLIRGYNYYLLGVDDATRYTWVALLKTLNTDKVLSRIKEIVARVQNFTGNNVAWIKADNRKGEFGRQFQDELIFRGIEFKPCPPYKHLYNSVVKRAIYTMDCKTRSLLFKGNIPVELWCYVVEHSVWLKNRVPTSALSFDEIKHNSAITLYEADT
jgi:hypothetical protein